MKTTKRSGMIMIMAMVCVAVAGVVFLTMAKTAAARRQAIETEAWRMQAAWLAESAVSRAAAHLAQDTTYSGEAFQISAEELGGRDSAAVRIEVATPSDHPELRYVSIQADCPDDSHRRARCSKQVTITVPSQSQESNDEQANE